MCNIDKHLSKQQLIQYRMRVLKDAERHGVAKAARRYGISRFTIYAWRKSVQPHKRGPSSPVSWQTDQDTEAIIIQLKLATGYGPKRLRPELELIGIGVGEKAIRGVLQRADLVAHHHKRRRKKTQRFYAPYPGYRLQIDTKAIENGKPDKRQTDRYQFTAIDIASKIRFLQVYDGLATSYSIEFTQQALAFYEAIGIRVECVQTDNHGTFTNLYLGGNQKAHHAVQRVHPLTKYLVGQGIAHKLSRPGTPQHNGFVERSHRTDEEEFYGLRDVTRLNIEQLKSEMKQWQDDYNWLRLHSSCENKPPMKHYLEAASNVLQTGA